MLSRHQLEKLHQEGFLVVENVLDASNDLDPILGEMEAILDNLVVALQQQGRIADTFSGLDFGERLSKIIAATGESFSQHFDFSLPKGHICANAPMYLGEALFRLIQHDKLLDCLEDVLETSEIYSNPVQHVRLKPPEVVAPPSSGRSSVLVNETPWHQDNAVLTTDADETAVWTVWIPLATDVDEHNGCLKVIPRSHLSTDLVVHCPVGGGVLRIPDKLIDPARVESVPVQRGSVLIMHRRLMHASYPNLSNRLRSSLDLRYQPVGQPTGRAVFPGFVVRSRLHPERVLHNREDWERLWNQARQKLSVPDQVEPDFDRWSGNVHEMCA